MLYRGQLAENSGTHLDSDNEYVEEEESEKSESDEDDSDKANASSFIRLTISAGNDDDSRDSHEWTFHLKLFSGAYVVWSVLKWR